MKNQEYLLRKAFTLIEVIMGVLIFAIVLIGGFKAYSSVLIGKIKLIEATDIQKEAFYFSEKFFEEIKKGGTIDYEEYFNRRVVGTSTQSGHYDKLTGFGNYGNSGGAAPYGSGFYYCRSGIGNLMGTEGCYNNNDYRDFPLENGERQRYGEYSIQFIDYNSNADDDGGILIGDEDRDGNIIGDDDDEYLGEGPKAFSGSEVKEIYLISANKDKRTYFRWKITQDVDDTSNTCNTDIGGLGCQGTIEFLKLDGEDWGYAHDQIGPGVYDGIIDTWLINKDFSGKTNTDPADAIIASAGGVDYWQPLFGESINVSDVKFFMYPNKDLKLAWKDSSSSTNIAPYIRIQMKLSPTYNARRGIKGKIPEIKINTTISLTDIYSR